MARESRKASKKLTWRIIPGLAVLSLVCVSTAMAGFRVRRFVLTDPQFVLSRDRKDALTIEGLKYTSRSKVRRVFAADFDGSIFKVPLPERRRRLLAIDWVEDASISRIWPDRLVVRIRERKPVAFVFFRSGVLLIDAQGVLLDPPPQAQFAFPVLRGIGENESDAEVLNHVRSFLRVEDDLGYLAKEISEVDTADPENIRLVAQMENRAVVLTMGDGNFARRYQNFLDHYPEIRKRSPNAKTFDLRLNDRITVKE